MPVRSRRLHRPLAVVAVSLLVAMTAPALSLPDADASSFALPLGDRDLTEVRTVQSLAPGVELMTIVRGVEPAVVEQIGSTTRGPWRISVLSIDPKLAAGELRATYGADLVKVEKTSDLVRMAGGLAGVNASFFTFTKDPAYPGDPVGLSISRGVLLSEPGATSTEADLLIDAATNTVRYGHLSWSGSMRNTKTDATLALEFVNHPPVVPSACTTVTDPTKCTSSGDVTLFTPEFGPTPTGRGYEVVLDKEGCVTKARASRGVTLSTGQTSVQATGKQAATLRSLTASGCLKKSSKLVDEAGMTVTLTKTTYGVAGRYRLTRKGAVVVPTRTGSFHERNPRTFAGTASDGTIMLATVDGRRSTSVGATLRETAAVAQSLGLRDAVNLDGGGSTSMASSTGLINTPSGSTERAVGDALVYVP